MDKGKRMQFCGTPLSRSLNDRNNDDGPITARRIRLNQEQIVKDAQGRQRFHGAFTGGFSAGYYNTVDTVEGFKPREFVTHRGDKESNRGGSIFSHKPEDYMDDEDFGEFGIAPKKIRVNEIYSIIDHSQLKQSSLRNVSRPSGLSVGQKMLKHLSDGLDWLREATMFGMQGRDVTKNDFHGLGYKPLESRLPNSTMLSKNPLEAMLDKEGKRIKISGEAFGTGVLEDDDEDYLNNSDLYGYDDLSNYEFRGKMSSKLGTQRGKHSHQAREEFNFENPNLLPGFELAKDLDAVRLQDRLEDEYKPPKIPTEWRMPFRDSPYIPPVDESVASQKLKLIGHQSSTAFNKRFISGSDRLATDEICTKAGLLHYSDLKATVAPREQEPIKPDAVEATIARLQFEWRPCSLLCKHFNVPNPYPGDSFVGTKSVDGTKRPLESCVSANSGEESSIRQEPASLALKQSIFNVIFQEDQTNDCDQPLAEGYGNANTDSEDEPQLVEIKPSSLAAADDLDSGEDQDIVIVTTRRPEPEVIVLSSSCSSSPSPRRKSTSRQRKAELNIETYGPALPPTSNSTNNLDSHRSSVRHRSSRQKKKSKKHKKHKRHG